MTQSIRSALSALLVISVITVQAYPFAVVFAEETPSATVTEAAPAVESPAQEVSAPGPEVSLPAAETETPDTPVPEESATEESATQESALSESTTEETGSVSNESEDQYGIPVTASAESASTTATENLGAGYSNTESSSSSSSSTSESVSLDVTQTGSSSGETHDNLDISATSSDPAFSINGVLDEINGIASSTAAGFATTSLAGYSNGAGDDWTDPAATGTPSSASSTSDFAAQADSNDATTAASGTPAVVSGDAVAVANILNILNSTFLNSEGSIIFANYLNQAGSIDFRNPAYFLGLCGQVSCSGDTEVQLNLDNNGTINNDIDLSASTGVNDLESTEGGAILTGDALAGLNLINLANVTVANSNYLLIALNAFRGISGDVVFPSLIDFFAPLLSQSAGDADVENLHNDGSVVNDVVAGANSGDNTVAIGENGTSTISSGNAYAQTNVFNQINSLLAGSGLSILFRLSGDWRGEVQGAPDGISWVRTPDGILFTGTSPDTQAGPGTTISGTSTAAINNGVRIGALTGANDLIASTTGTIETGEAFAGANVINVANQTVVGRNWIMAIINIFGDFNGNIAFGKPDLWVGAQASAPATIRPGSGIEYRISIMNRGDAVASDARLRETIDGSKVRVVSSSIPYEQTGNTLLFNLGDIPAGDARTVTYKTEVLEFVANDSITTASLAELHESDNNAADNRDSTVVRDAVLSGGGGYIPPILVAAVNFNTATSAPRTAAVSVTRENEIQNLSNLQPLSTQTVIIRNNSNFPATGVVINDLIKNPDGTVIHEEMFDLGTMTPGEEVAISYDISFGKAAPGTYVIWTELVGSNVPPQVSRNGEVNYTVEASVPHVLGSTIETVEAPEITRTPKVPNTGSVETLMPLDWTGQAAITPVALTAAAGSIDKGIADSYGDLVSFALLLAMVFGAVRMVRPRLPL